MKTKFLFALLLAASAAHAEVAPTRISGEDAAPEPKAARVATFRMAQGTAPSSKVRLGALDASVRERLNAGQDIDEKRVAVGASRSIAGEALSTEGSGAPKWTAAGSGFATQVEITSAGALSLRLALRAKSLPAGAEIRVRGTTARVVGPISAETVVAATLDQGAYWTPVTEGETQSVEIWVPAGADTSRTRFSIETLSHLTAKPSSLFKTAGSCHEDVVCHASSNPALAKAARSVAKLVYTENGVTYMCSGTLINDGDQSSQVPYLYTAAHCIGTQAAAATLNTFWFFDAAACGSKGTADFRQLSGGATLLYANTDTDAALVRLTDRAPEGAWFSGWDAATLAPGTALVGLHHPGGELKKIAMGQALEPTAATGGSYATATWLAGTTERGSSGSGIFSLSGGEYVLRGGLKGGSASCESSGKPADPSNRDYYSRVDLEAPKLRTWLAAGPAPLQDYTDMWWNPAEPGWGVSVQQHADNRVFATYYLYDRDGKPTWLVMPEARWATAFAVEGAVYRASGPGSEGAYDAKRFSVTPVGTARIEFAHDGQATLTLSVEGRMITKPLQRQAF
jgi:lysyl endopeptidase